MMYGMVTFTMRSNGTKIALRYDDISRYSTREDGTLSVTVREPIGTDLERTRYYLVRETFEEAEALVQQSLYHDHMVATEFVRRAQGASVNIPVEQALLGLLDLAETSQAPSVIDCEDTDSFASLELPSGEMVGFLFQHGLLARLKGEEPTLAEEFVDAVAV
jgi:hypothetical protein